MESYENEISLDYEVAGIHDILKNCSAFNVPMAGVYIDGELKAFTVGSLNERENMAVIHIEKQILRSTVCISSLTSSF